MNLGNQYVSAISFWVLEESDGSSNFGQTGFVEVDGAVWSGSQFDPHANVGRNIWQQVTISLNRAVSTLVIFGYDITNSGSLFIDDVLVTTSGSGSALSQDFESGLGNWTATPIGATSHGTSTLRAHGGSRAYRMGRSTCSSNCYGNNNHGVRLSLPLGQYVSTLTFWVLEESDGSSNFGQTGFVEVDGQMVSGSQFDPHSNVGRNTWQLISISLNRQVSTLSIYAYDITNSGSVFVDDIVINP